MDGVAELKSISRPGFLDGELDGIGGCTQTIYLRAELTLTLTGTFLGRNLHV